MYIFFCHWKGSTSFYRAHFGQGSGPILIGNAHCNGEESSLLECNINMNGLFSCSHFEDAGVRCQGILNLMGAPQMIPSGCVHNTQTEKGWEKHCFVQWHHLSKTSLAFK